MKRWLFLIHRWLGIVACLFMLLWFVSGVVMMYVGYPKLTSSERLARLPELDGSRCCISVGDAARALPPDVTPTSIMLTSAGARPQYQFSIGKKIFAVDGISGAALGQVAASEAMIAAQVFMPQATPHYLDRVDEDTWTHTRGLDMHRPLHRVQMDDAEQTLLYVSGVTGEVVRKATRTERIWNYAGAWLHWLYAFRGGPLDGAWNNIVIYLSLAGVVVALSGSIIGIWRWRFRGRFRSGAKTPYREPVMRWHHLIGLVFAGITLTWVFSGLMSMNPWDLFKSSGPALNQRAYAGAKLDPQTWPLASSDALRLLPPTWHAKELRWHLFNGKPYLIAINGIGAGRTRMIDALSHRVSDDVPQAQLMQAAATLSDAPIASAELLQREDAYYYGREAHTMMGGMQHPLPVWRIAYADAAQTWVHIDPATGVLLGKLDYTQRIKRWLFAFLHSWDLPVLLASRPLWDIALILLSLGGVALSATGVIIGVRRLRHFRP